MRPSRISAKETSEVPTLLRAIVGDVHLAVHSDEPPSDADWQEYVEVVRAERSRLRCTLVFTDGPGPDPDQRAQLSDVPNVTELLTAVVTSSFQARGIVTALSWFGHNIKAFKPSDLQAAFAFLKIPIDQRRTLLDHIASFRAQLAGTNLDDLVDGVPTSSTRETAQHTVINERLDRVRARALAKREGTPEAFSARARQG